MSQENETKWCSLCKKTKELHEFYNESAKGSSQNHKQNRCIECMKKESKNYRR